MNAKFLERLITYRSQWQIQVCKTLISQKIINQFRVLKIKKESTDFLFEIEKAENLQSILLIEARSAKKYWELYSGKISNKTNWYGRRPHSSDVINQLLDIGYHYITQHISKNFIELSIPTEIGFLHKAQSKNSDPLVYDFIEWIRPVLVDIVLLKLINKKKLVVEKIDDKIIKYFIFLIKKSLEKSFYHRKLKYCITLDYWIKLILLDFEKSVNLNKKFKPLFPSLRNETRCKTKATKETPRWPKNSID